jgi:hypothetical protein
MIGRERAEREHVTLGRVHQLFHLRELAGEHVRTAKLLKSPLCNSTGVCHDKARVRANSSEHWIKLSEGSSRGRKGSQYVGN